MKSTQGIDQAFDIEVYHTKTIQNGFFFRQVGKPESYIPMLRQSPYNCTTASSEGVFLATIYCNLVKRGFESSLAKELALKYSKQVFEINRKMEVDAIKIRLGVHHSFLACLGTKNVEHKQEAEIIPLRNYASGDELEPEIDFNSAGWGLAATGEFSQEDVKELKENVSPSSEVIHLFQLHSENDEKEQSEFTPLLRKSDDADSKISRWGACRAAISTGFSSLTSGLAFCCNSFFAKRT